MIDPLYESYSGDNTALQYVLACFPYICYQIKLKEVLAFHNTKSREQVAKKISVFAFSFNDDVSTNATTALRNFISISPEEYFVVVMNSLIDFVEKSLDHSSEHVLIAVKNFCYFLDYYTSLVEKEGSKLGRKLLVYLFMYSVEAGVWSKLRESIEINCMIWLLHNDPNVWTKTLVLLTILGKNILK